MYCNCFRDCYNYDDNIGVQPEICVNCFDKSNFIKKLSSTQPVPEGVSRSPVLSERLPSQEDVVKYLKDREYSTDEFINSCFNTGFLAGFLEGIQYCKKHLELS
jgi:hypothetical protein